MKYKGVEDYAIIDNWLYLRHFAGIERNSYHEFNLHKNFRSIGTEYTVWTDDTGEAIKTWRREA